MGNNIIESRTLGRTGLVVSRLGLGLAALGRPGYINLGHAADLGRSYDEAAMRAHAESVLDCAWNSGIRYFDAARSYGKAESFLGGWLQQRNIDPASVTVGSKWGYVYTAGWQIDAEKHEIKDHGLANLLRQQAESKLILGRHLRLYQIHSATLESGVLDHHPIAAELVRLRQEEGIRIGLSLSGPQQAATLRRAMQIAVDGEPVFDCVQATWNLLERSAGPALAEAHEAGIGVIVKEGLANGRLTARNQDPGFAQSRAMLERQAARLGTTLDALSLAVVLAQPWADVVLSGAATGEQLASNVRALQVHWDDEAERELSAIAEPAESYWRTRAALSWN